MSVVPSAAPVAVTGAWQESSWQRLLGQLGQVRAMRLPVLLRGERGTGKTVLARCLHDQAADQGPFTVLDAAAVGTREDWVGQLRAALADPAGTVVLQHLNALDPALAGPTVSLLECGQARLGATATERAGERTGLAAVSERFPVILDVPPLRERAADIPALVTGIIRELRSQAPRPRCTPEALAALADSEWPGNTRQLRQVVATALVRSMSCDISVDDLPFDYAGAGHGRRLTRLERVERQMLVTALRDAAWDREAAARDLGISISREENPAYRWISPDDAGAVVVRAIKRGDLYALTHPDWYGMVEQRHQAIASAFQQAADQLPRPPR